MRARRTRQIDTTSAAKQEATANGDVGDAVAVVRKIERIDRMQATLAVAAPVR